MKLIGGLDKQGVISGRKQMTAATRPSLSIEDSDVTLCDQSEASVLKQTNFFWIQKDREHLF